MQLLGFLVGCTLVVWCVMRAASSGSDGLEKLRNAPPMLVAILLGSTLVSIICSGFTFWSMARPIRRFTVIEMQAVNLMASLFNYAPVRLGLVLRCAFHWRVERMSVFCATRTVMVVIQASSGPSGRHFARSRTT